jgi:ketosteroid isomerase-like protein
MNYHMSRTIYAFCVLFTLSVSSCRKQQPVDLAKSVADADRYYSALSLEKGRNAAFLAMFDSAGVTLAPHKYPIEGYVAIKKILLSRSDTTYTLTWEPRFAKVAASGELGYTYGTYKLTSRATKSLIQEGTYTTIWHKNAQGEWKALLDTGNEGLK